MRSTSTFAIASLVSLVVASPVLVPRSPPNAFTFNINCTEKDFAVIANASDVCAKVLKGFTTAGQTLSNVFDIAVPLKVKLIADKRQLAPTALAYNEIISPIVLQNADGRPRRYTRALAKQVLNASDALDDEREDIKINLNIDLPYYFGDDEYNFAGKAHDIRWLALHEMMHGLGFGSDIRRSEGSHDLYPKLDSVYTGDDIVRTFPQETLYDRFIHVLGEGADEFYSVSEKINEALTPIRRNGSITYSWDDFQSFRTSELGTEAHRTDKYKYSLMRYLLRRDSQAEAVANQYLNNLTEIKGKRIFAFVTASGDRIPLSSDDTDFNDDHGLEHLHAAFATTPEFLMQPKVYTDNLEELVAIMHGLPYHWSEGEPKPTHINLDLAIGPRTRDIMTTLGWKLRSS